MPIRSWVWIPIALVLSSVLAGCAQPLAQLPARQPASQPRPKVLRLATTTSTADSGLLDEIIPDFEQKCNIDVDVIAVGTGQALAIGAHGDADVVLVHARAREEQFVADGHAPARYDVMYNDFVIVGPPEDPAGIQGSGTAAEAFAKIASASVPFASRGDDSGTHSKEKSVWAEAGREPGTDDPWYNSLGQGMGSTLIFANERRAYTLTDRGTFLSMRDHLPNLKILVGGQSIADNPDTRLFNPYGVMPIDPKTHPGVNYELAMKFIDWLTSPAVQKRIGEFGVARFGQPLFYPRPVVGDQ